MKKQPGAPELKPGSVCASARMGLAVRAICCCLMLATTGYAQDDDEADQPTVQVESRYTEEVRQLLQSAEVQDAMQHIEHNEPRALKDLLELTQIPAPPFGEAQRADRFAELLREAGLADVRIDDVGNVIGRRPGHSADRTVAFAAHLDTVFPAETDLTVKQEGTTYFAPGIGDNTRGLVAVLEVLRAMQSAGLRTDADILFIGNVGEEGLGDLRGVKHLFREGSETIDTLIAVDGGDAERLVYGGVGSNRYRMIIEGPGGHSWGAFGSANPHHALGRAIALFDELADPITRQGEKSSYNIGRIGGGTSINSIPFESWAEVDIRSGDPEKIQAIDDALHLALQKAVLEENEFRRKGPELMGRLERVGLRPAARGATDSALVQRAAAAMRSQGIEPQLTISSTDANLPLSLGIPAITMSRGGVSGDSHSPQEWWRNENAHLAVQAGLLTLLSEAEFVNQ